MKGLPMTYNRDMQEDKEPLFEAADQLSGSLEMARVVVGFGQARLQRSRLRRRKRAGWWRPIWPKRWRATARRFIRRTRLSGGWCWKACAQGKKPADWTAAELAAFAPEFTAGYGAAARAARKA